MEHNKDYILQEYAKGKSTRQLARELHLHHKTISNWLKRWDVYIRVSYNYSENLKNQVVKLYKSGISTIEIGKKYQINDRTIGRWLKSRGINRDNKYSFHTSRAEKELFNYVNKLYFGWVANDRKTIKNYLTNRYLELDMVHHDLKLAIEYNGKRWHSNDKVKVRDKIKKKLCQKLKYQLITINDEEWKLNKNLIKSKLRNVILRKKYGRK